RAAGGQHVVHDEHPLTGREGVLVHLDGGGPVLELVAPRVGGAGQTALLADRDEARAQLTGDRGREDEAACLDAGHLVHRPVPLGQRAVRRGLLPRHGCYRRFFLPLGRRLAALVRRGCCRGPGRCPPGVAPREEARPAGTGAPVAAAPAASSPAASAGPDPSSGPPSSRASPGATPAAAPFRAPVLAASRLAARPLAARWETRLASALYCGSRSLRSARTGVAMQIEE